MPSAGIVGVFMLHHRATNSKGTIHLSDCDSGGDYKSKLERHGFILWIMDPDVIRVQLQKPRIPYIDAAGEPHHYTGDLFIEFRPHLKRRPLVVECKYANKLARDPELKIKHDVVCVAMNRLGRDFVVQTEKNIYGPGFAMKKFAFDHRNNEAHRAQPEILNHVRRHSGVSVGDLVAALRVERIPQLELVPEVWRLCALHLLRVDFEKCLNLTTKIYAGPQLEN